jgi:hypothetical protein
MIPVAVLTTEDTEYAYGPNNYALYKPMHSTFWRVSASMTNEKLEKMITQQPSVDLGNKYHMTIIGLDGVITKVDVYRVIDAYQIQDAGLQHAIKKILMAGHRGHKDFFTDLREAVNSINQTILLEQQKNAITSEKTS